MNKKNKNTGFTFEISLSVLNHLGRNLYRSFSTVLGEAISNSWDADAENVWIYVDRKRNNFCIIDDGGGMDAVGFQNRFLKIGYSKRKEGDNVSAKGRRFIGRKGIGKLALLSCADRITVVSKARGKDYVGGVIDNSGLNKAITNDLSPQDYPLVTWDKKKLSKYIRGHKNGTIIYFEQSKDGIKHGLDFLKKTIALYFRFSLVDPSFRIFVNDELVDQDCLGDLIGKTEFLWELNTIKDPFLEKLKKTFTTEKNEKKRLKVGKDIRGFIASVERPRDLKIMTADEKLGVDLYVNGRMREKDILKHIPTAKVAENYLYGQIHFDILDDDMDRFTSSREGVISADPQYKKFLKDVDKTLRTILADWDQWRIRHRKDGDSENESVSKKDRKSRELFNVVSGEYFLPKGNRMRRKVDDWVDDLGGDAAYNFSSYADCFLSENLIRKYVEEKKLELSQDVRDKIKSYKNQEKISKSAGNINIELRECNKDLSYLDIAGLANIVERGDAANRLPHDAKQYKPIRDALMHTARLSDEAKRKLTSVYDNIRGRIHALLQE